MQKLKEVLLAQYIGAIVIGLIVANGLMQLIGLVVTPIQHWSLQMIERRSIFGERVDPEKFQWAVLITPAVTTALYLVVAFLLLRWLYLVPEGGFEDRPEEQLPEEQP